MNEPNAYRIVISIRSDYKQLAKRTKRRLSEMNEINEIMQEIAALDRCSITNTIDTILVHYTTRT